MKGDIRSDDDLDRCKEFGEIDSVVHLAAIPWIKRCEEEPELARSVNVEGTENVLEFARRNDVEEVVFSSSAGVYGEIVEHPITEEHPKDPLNLYSETKLEGEKLCERHGEEYGLGTTVMRMSNLYGPNYQVKPNPTVVPIFILQAMLNKPLTIYGDGEQTRDFVHVKDVTQGFKLAIENCGKNVRTYNLGSGQTTSINRLASVIKDIFEKLYDREVEIEHIEMPESRDEAKEEFDYSIEKIKRKLGYEPEYRLNEGIGNILRF